MKHVHALQVIGTPVATCDQIACPTCAKNLTVFTDGSAFCSHENKYFQPEVTDIVLFARRQKFDKTYNISTSARLLSAHNAILGPSMRQHYWHR